MDTWFSKPLEKNVVGLAPLPPSQSSFCLSQHLHSPLDGVQCSGKYAQGDRPVFSLVSGPCEQKLD